MFAYNSILPQAPVSNGFLFAKSKNKCRPSQKTYIDVLADVHNRCDEGKFLASRYEWLDHSQAEFYAESLRSCADKSSHYVIPEFPTKSGKTFPIHLNLDPCRLSSCPNCQDFTQQRITKAHNRAIDSAKLPEGYIHRYRIIRPPSIDAPLIGLHDIWLDILAGLRRSRVYKECFIGLIRSTEWVKDATGLHFNLVTAERKSTKSDNFQQAFEKIAIKQLHKAGYSVGYFAKSSSRNLQTRSDIRNALTYSSKWQSYAGLKDCDLAALMDSQFKRFSSSGIFRQNEEPQSIYLDSSKSKLHFSPIPSINSEPINTDNSSKLNRKARFKSFSNEAKEYRSQINFDSFIIRHPNIKEMIAMDGEIIPIVSQVYH